LELEQTVNKVVLSPLSRWIFIHRSLVLVTAALIGSAACGWAAEPEQRVYGVYANGKPAGEHRMTITTQEDGTQIMTAEAEVQVRHRFGTYRYSYRGTETWKEGRLLKLDASSNDDGKRHTVSAVLAKEGLMVTANGRRIIVQQPDVWTATHWQMPTVAQRKQGLPILDTDTGEVQSAKLDEMGPAQVSVNGQVVDCTHYRLTGAMPADLWFDANGRLVRQEWTEDGYRMLLHLNRIGR
jgi:hypothetical protein